VPLRLLILAFAAGAALLQMQPALPDLRWAWLLPPAGLALGLLPIGRFGRLLKAALILALVLAAGFLYAAWRAELRLADALPVAWEGRDIRLSGRVDGLPEKTPRGWRFVLDVVGVATPGAQAPGRVQLSLASFAGPVMTGPVGGQCLAVTARLSRPHASVNFGGFDYDGWLLARDIRAQGYVVDGFAPSDACGYSLKAVLDGWREAMRRRLAAALAGEPYAGVVAGLAVGDQNAIPDAQWTLFRNTGVTHLMSISGLHVTLLAGMVFALVNWGWRRIGWLAVRLPARQAASLAGFATALWYVAMTGFGLPAQRTLYMVGMVAVALWLGRINSPSRVLAAALGLVVALDPWAALAPGFWLSFGAVSVLFYVGSGRLARPPLWREWLQAQWAVTLALTPVLLLLFHGVSLVSPLANAFAIPLISLVAVPLVLAAALLPIPFLAHAAHAVIALTMVGLNRLAALPQPVWHVADPTWPALLSALLGTLVLLMPRGVPGRWLGLVLFLPLLFPPQDRLVPGEFRLDMLDVGQGLAVVIRTDRHALVYDTGPRYASGEDAGARVVEPFLFARGIERLDGLVVSHEDSDHSGGAASLLASQDPAKRLASYPLAGADRCAAGERWVWDGVEFAVLHPQARFYGQPGFSGNDMSCVLRVSSPYGSVLLTGDVARLGELSLMELPTDRLRAGVLVVPHHGSGGSSMQGFVEAVKPDTALISVGYRNRFGHPAAETLERYRMVGARVVRTDRTGGVRIDFRAGGREEHWARNEEKRYWRSD
jgi:competence protein ComEC